MTIPEAEGLLAGLCAAAGLCLVRAELVLRGQITALREQAVAVQSAGMQFRDFWCAMLNGLPTICRLLISATCCWQRRIHCEHQGRRLCLGEPPWQPKTANAMAAAPGAAAAVRCATNLQAHARCCSLAAGAASCDAAASSSTSTHERASCTAARRDVQAVCACLCRLSLLDGDPRERDGGLKIIVPPS